MTIFSEIFKKKYTMLSPGQKKVGKYILENFEESTYETLAKMSSSIGVSETTIIRTSYALGFESFSQMQKNIRAEFHNKNSDMIINDSISEIETSEFYKDILKREIELLHKTLKNIDEEELEKITQKAASAKNIFSVASKSNYGAALWFATTVSKFKDHVHIVKADDEEMLNKLLLIDSDSIVFCVTFERYSKATFNFAKMAKERGAYVVAIIDSKFSPLGEIADLNLITYSNKDDTGFNTISGATAVLNILAVGIRKHLGNSALERLTFHEQLSNELNLIFE